MNRETGIYAKTNVTGETVRAFIPFPLPPTEPPLEINDNVQSLLDHAREKLGELELASRLIPSLEWFIYAYVRKEAVTSSQIEGTQTTLADLLTLEADEHFEKDANPDIEEVCNYLDAIRYAREELRRKNGLPLSMRLLNETHKRLMKGARGGDKRPGEIRQSQNWIGGSRPGNAAFVPPPPSELPKLSSDFEKYIHAEDGLPPLIRIALLHVQFETIHPYLDGNGRMGRLLITLLLEHWGLLTQPLLYLSLFFKWSRDEYYRLLGEVRSRGDWESWVVFFLTGVCKIAEDAVRLARHLSQIVKEDRQKVIASPAVTTFALKLFELLPMHPVVTMAKAVKLLKTSKPTALKAIAILQKTGVLKENTGRQRGRHFEYTDYLAKLKFGADLKMYRIVLNYAYEEFAVKGGKITYKTNASYDFFWETLPEAEKYYKLIVKKLKNMASLRSAALEFYDSRLNQWLPKKSSLLWPGDDGDISTLHASDAVQDKLASLQSKVNAVKL